MGRTKVVNMRRRQRQAFAACTIVAVMALASGPALAFKERWHKAIIWSALSFVDVSYRSQIAAVQDEMDGSLCYAGVDVWHFNDCDFSGASKNLAAVYEDTVAALKRGDANEAARLFGRALHTAQDFYAHTNWIDLKPPGRDRMTALVDTNDGPWQELVPWQRLPSQQRIVPVSETHGRPKGVTIIATKPPNRATIGVSIGGVAHAALISGEATWRMNCPAEVAIGHWDSAEQSRGLAKDYPCRDPARSFHAACTLALRQTYQEWCRLTTLASGDPAARQTLDGMVKDPGTAAKICADKRFLADDFSGGCRWPAPR
jgi:hypothetical protein